ncbi:MAG: hypothetical protein P8Y97_00705 [Candidatus Lokiarchaeota archaeon]
MFEKNKQGSSEDIKENDEDPHSDKKLVEEEKSENNEKENNLEQFPESANDQEESSEDIASNFLKEIASPIKLEKIKRDLIKPYNRRVSLTKSLKKLQIAAGLEAPEDFISTDVAKLKSYIKSEDIPKNIEGKDEDEKKEKYIKVLMGLAERTYPTKIFKKKLSEENIQEKVKWENLKEFIGKNPNIDPTNPNYKNVDWEGRSPDTVKFEQIKQFNIRKICSLEKFRNPCYGGFKVPF